MTVFLQIYKQAESDFQQLYSKIRDLNEKMNYPRTDVRHGALQSLMQICMWGLFEIRNFQNHGIINTLELMNQFGLNKQDTTVFANSIDVFLRASFLTIFMFETENLLRTIRNKLPESGASNKYYDITKDVLQVTHPDNISEIHDALQLPAYVRNCLHNSGIHTNASKSFTIRDVTYDFIQCQMFNRADWSNIVIFIDELVNVLDDILSNSNVKNLSIIKI